MEKIILYSKINKSNNYIKFFKMILDGSLIIKKQLKTLKFKVPLL